MENGLSLTIDFERLVENFTNKKSKQKPFRNMFIHIVISKLTESRFILYNNILFVPQLNCYRTITIL